jgi:hypothetical protein
MISVVAQTDWWTVSAAWAAALAAAIAAFLSWRTLCEIARQRWPMVLVHPLREIEVKPERRWELRVENVGLGCAFDVSVKLQGVRSEIRLPMLPPGSSLTHIVESDRPSAVTVSWYRGYKVASGSAREAGRELSGRHEVVYPVQLKREGSTLIRFRDTEEIRYELSRIVSAMKRVRGPGTPFKDPSRGPM